jgi:hypothetical protein
MSFVLRVASKTFMLSVIVLNAVMLNVVAQGTDLQKILL